MWFLSFLLFLSYSNSFFSRKMVGSFSNKSSQNIFLKDISLFKNPRENAIDSKNLKNEISNLIYKKTNLYFSNTQTDLFLQNNDFIKNKKLISISPGGFQGFYIAGICTYIKENYNVEDYIFSGASAGAWNSLFMTFKGEPLDFILDLLDDKSMKKFKSIHELEYIIKYKIMSQYSSDDFDLCRLFIGITTLQNFQIKTNIFSDFDDLEDALNACIASSHIPFITGGLTNKYHDMYSFDGGFGKYPYLNITKPTLHISPSLFSSEKKTKSCDFVDYTSLFSKDKYDLVELFYKGYDDAKNNKLPI
jgi:hypothetical protein